MFAISHIFRIFGRPVYWFGCPKKQFSSFLFSVVFQQKYVEVAIYEFKMHLITLKWLKIQKCRQKRKTMIQRSQSGRINYQQKCFHSLTT